MFNKLRSKLGGKLFDFQKKYVAFFSIVTILVVTSIVQVDCPICDGTGNLSISPGMENVKVREIDSEQNYFWTDICSAYITYQYRVTLSLVNEGTEDVTGWIKFVLRDYSEGSMIDRQYAMVSIPTESNMEATFKVWFQSGLDVPSDTEVFAEPVIDALPDDTCNGTGELSLNSWLMVNVLKDSFEEVVTSELEFEPPPPYFPPEGGDTDE
ncbi:hypothetical protein ACFLYS_03305 [Chloroflexota bacterium]